MIDQKDWNNELGLFAYEDEKGYSKALLTTLIELKIILSNGELNLRKIKEMGIL
ncbi:MAG: hypothetical protein KAG53_01055 [Endozoicomonadaceae bacterium]|nr:hypothetical protein [Endozoicomonadaceae bacterium]